MQVVRMANESGVRDAVGVIRLMEFVGLDGQDQFSRVIAALSEVVSALDDMKEEGKK